MATRRRRTSAQITSASLTRYAEDLSNAWINGNQTYVLSEIKRLKPAIAAYIAVRVHMSLHHYDSYQGSSFVRRLEDAV